MRATIPPHSNNTAIILYVSVQRYHRTATKQQQYCLSACNDTTVIIIINPLTARVVGAPQMILQPVFSIFPYSPLPSGTCRTPGLSIPWGCLSTHHGFLPWDIRVAFPGESQLLQSRATRPTVHAGCVSVPIIHQTRTWTTWSLTRAQVLMHATAHGGVRTP